MRKSRRTRRRGRRVVVDSSNTPLFAFDSPLRQGRTTSGWRLLGGVWPQRLENVSPDYQLYYCVLRSAMETLVRNYEGKTKHGPDMQDTRDDFKSVVSWIFDPNYDAPLKLSMVARAGHFRVKNFRKFIEESGILG